MVFSVSINSIGEAHFELVFLCLIMVFLVVSYVRKCMELKKYV